MGNFSFHFYNIHHKNQQKFEKNLICCVKLSTAENTKTAANSALTTSSFMLYLEVRSTFFSFEAVMVPPCRLPCSHAFFRLPGRALRHGPATSSAGPLSIWLNTVVAAARGSWPRMGGRARGAAESGAEGERALTDVLSGRRHEHPLHPLSCCSVSPRNPRGSLRHGAPARARPPRHPARGPRWPRRGQRRGQHCGGGAARPSARPSACKA